MFPEDHLENSIAHLKKLKTSLQDDLNKKNRQWIDQKSPPYERINPDDLHKLEKKIRYIGDVIFQLRNLFNIQTDSS
tara:strand:- start:1872 stop:2102 length:231 start_codon:yes stop_codon:yes gene_type:complete